MVPVLTGPSIFDAHTTSASSAGLVKSMDQTAGLRALESHEGDGDRAMVALEKRFILRLSYFTLPYVLCLTEPSLRVSFELSTLDHALGMHQMYCRKGPRAPDSRICCGSIGNMLPSAVISFRTVCLLSSGSPFQRFDSNSPFPTTVTPECLLFQNAERETPTHRCRDNQMKSERPP